MPSALDVFDADAFSYVSLTKAINLMSHVPTMLTQMPGLFEDVPVRTKEVWIERMGDQPAIIQTTARGAPGVQVGGDRRDARAFNTFRLKLQSKIRADELLTIRRFGSEIDIKDMQTEVARRMFKLSARHDLTMEFHRFNVVTQGKSLDWDPITGAIRTLYDWTAEFSAAPNGARTLSTPSEVAFNFSAGIQGTNLGPRGLANGLVRAIKRNLTMVQGSDTIISADNAQIVAICGDSFYDQLTTHPEVRATYLNWDAAAQLRDSVGEVWRPLRYAGVEWINYRGTDDVTGQQADTTGASSATSFGVGTNHAKFFPRNAGIFQIAYAPGEKFEHLGSLGQQRYAQIVRDVQRDEWVELETMTYPLPVCVLPQALASGRAGT
jgi:hypothetical protein